MEKNQEKWSEYFMYWFVEKQSNKLNKIHDKESVEKFLAEFSNLYKITAEFINENTFFISDNYQGTFGKKFTGAAEQKVDIFNLISVYCPLNQFIEMVVSHAASKAKKTPNKTIVDKYEVAMKNVLMNTRQIDSNTKVLESKSQMISRIADTIISR